MLAGIVMKLIIKANHHPMYDNIRSIELFILDL